MAYGLREGLNRSSVFPVHLLEGASKECTLKEREAAWVKTMLKHPKHYYFLIKEYVDVLLVMFQGLEDAIPWKEAPGYSVVIRPLLRQIQHSPPTNHSPMFIDCCKKLMHNPHLLSVFLHLLFPRTNIHDSVAVYSCCDLVISWFGALQEHRLPLPSSFDFDYFFGVLETLLSCSHYVVNTEALLMIWNVMVCFSGEQRRRLCETILLGKFFFVFFLHWESSIRSIYQHLLLYKVQRGMTSLYEETRDSDEYYRNLVFEHIAMVQDQLDGKAQHFPEHLNVYGSLALVEYMDNFLKYTEWEVQPEKPVYDNLRKMFTGGLLGTRTMSVDTGVRASTPSMEEG